MIKSKRKTTKERINEININQAYPSEVMYEKQIIKEQIKISELDQIDLIDYDDMYQNELI